MKNMPAREKKVHSARTILAKLGRSPPQGSMAEDWVNGGWENDVQQMNTYDENGNRRSALEKTWNKGNWVNFSFGQLQV